jgi:hypothetical protein
MADSRFSAPRLIKIGLSLLFGGTAATVFVLAGGLFGIHTVTLLDLSVGIPLLAVLLGFVLMCVGAARWALQSPVKKLTSFGIAFLGLSVVCYLIIIRIPAGFDDPIILLLLIPVALFILGVLLLLCAGIREVRAATGRTAD